MVVVKKWVLVQAFDGIPKASDLELCTEILPDNVTEGELLCETLYLTVDPYMRLLSPENPSSVGQTMQGHVVAKVVASADAAYPTGCLVASGYGWQTHALFKTKDKSGQWGELRKVTDELDELSPSLAIGALGMPGATAYLGTMKILDPKPGEVFFVNAAAGAVGSIVGQIGKIKGCKVIGCAGSEAKCSWLTELGFDYVFNYKKSELNTELRKAAPDGIDCFFDNVGGNATTTILMEHMRLNGRIAVCGTISTYNAGQVPTGATPWTSLLMKQLKVQGFKVPQWYPEWPEAFSVLAQWIREGKLQTRETITEGFENMPKAFIGLFTGENIGKAIVKV